MLEAEDMDQALALMGGHSHLIMSGASFLECQALNVPGM